MDKPTTTHDWIDRWTGLGLVDPEQADALHADAEAVDPAATPMVERALAAAGQGIMETLGYLGSAITIGAAAVALDVDSWSEPGIIALLAAITMLSVTGLVLLTPPRSDRGSRLAAVLGIAAVASLAGALSLAVPEPADTPLLVGLPTIALAGVLYARHRQLLLHLALGLATTGTIAAFGAGYGSDWRASETMTGVLLLLVATAWIVASETGVLDQPWLGTSAAAGVSHVGVGMITAMSFFEAGGLREPVVLSLALATAHAVTGALTDRVRLIVVGSIALVFTVPMTFTEVFGWTATSTAFALLPVGLALTAWALWSARDEAT